MLALDSSADDMVEVVCTVDEHYDEFSDLICKKRRPKAEIAQEAFDELFASVELQVSHTGDYAGRLTYYPRARSLNAEKLSDALLTIEKVEEQRGELTRERDAACAEVEKYARSYSYRIGSMLLSFPRRVRQAFSKGSEGF